MAEDLAHRARLQPYPSEFDMLLPSNSVLHPLRSTNGLLWPYRPTITYTPAVEYQQLTLVHANQDYSAYTRTPSPQISVAGQMTAQTPNQALYAVAMIHFLRSVTRMRFGMNEPDAKKMEPPAKLLFSAYGKYNFYRIPVYVINFLIDLPNNVSYVEATTNVNNIKKRTWVPSVFQLTVTLQVQIHPHRWYHPSRKSKQQFDWNEFASGRMFDKGGWI